MIQKLGIALLCAFMAAGLVVGVMEFRDDRTDALRKQLHRATQERAEMADQIDQLTSQLTKRIRDLERFIRSQGLTVPDSTPTPSSPSSSGDSSQHAEPARRERPKGHPQPKPSPRPSPKPSPKPETCVDPGPVSVCINP